MAAAGTSYRLAALSEPEQNELAHLLDRARVDNPANKGGPVAPLPSSVEIWELQVVQRLKKNPKQYRRWVSRDLELIRTQPDRYEAHRELLDEMADHLGMAPRPTPETGV